MTSIPAPRIGADLHDDIARLTRAHGWLRVVLAALTARFRRPRRAIGPDDLSNHLRRDIGLTEAPPPASLPDRVGPLL